jgi:hypothetical protein
MAAHDRIRLTGPLRKRPREGPFLWVGDFVSQWFANPPEEASKNLAPFSVLAVANMPHNFR